MYFSKSFFVGRTLCLMSYQSESIMLCLTVSGICNKWFRFMLLGREGEREGERERRERERERERERFVNTSRYAGLCTQMRLYKMRTLPFSVLPPSLSVCLFISFSHYLSVVCLCVCLSLPVFLSPFVSLCLSLYLLLARSLCLSLCQLYRLAGR